MATHSDATSEQIPRRDNVLNVFQENERKYEEVSVIRTGAYGAICKAKDLGNSGQFVTLKKVRIPLTDGDIPTSTLREISLLKQLDSFRHPNLVRLFDICNGGVLKEENQMFLQFIFEYMDQDLSSYMQKYPRLGSDTVKDIAFQLLCGMEYLFLKDIVHRDLNPRNILVCSNGEVKLADFGSSSIYDSLPSSVTTLWYCPPEVLLRPTHTAPPNIWSGGCIIAELFRGKSLFRGENEFDQLNEIFEVIGSPCDAEWPLDASIDLSSFNVYYGVPLPTVIPNACENATELIRCMLMFSANERISYIDALQHEFFQDYMNNPPRPLKRIIINPFQDADEYAENDGSSERTE